MAYFLNSRTSEVVDTIASWSDQYKEQSIEMMHDDAMFDFVSPDDSLIVAGPSRLSKAGIPKYTGIAEVAENMTDFYVIGVCQSFQFSETSQIQPMKAIGSRRHLFTKTSTPVQASMARMMIFGKNLARVLYGGLQKEDVYSETGGGAPTRNNKYVQGGNDFDTAKFLTNLEEDLYRTPFGLGIIYHTPRTAHDSMKGPFAVAAEYLECCYLQNRNVSMQSGQTIVMEQVQMMADRVVPWDAYKQKEKD